MTDPISYIDDLKATGIFLMEIKKDSKKIDCLHAFVESSIIVNWIRNEAPEGNNGQFVSYIIYIML